jgi:hypothetical protein
MFRAKLNRFSKTTTDLSAISKRSCDLPKEQLRSASMPAFRPTADLATVIESNVSDTSTESGRHRTYPHIIDFEKPSVEATLKLSKNTIEKDTQEMTLVLNDDAPVSTCDSLLLPAEQVPLEQQIPVQQQMLALTPPAEPLLAPPPLVVPAWPSNLSAQTELDTVAAAASAPVAPSASLPATSPEATKPNTIWSVIDTVAFSRTVEQQEK